MGESVEEMKEFIREVEFFCFFNQLFAIEIKKEVNKMLTSVVHYLAIFLPKRTLSRFALFLWINPFDSAISIAFTAAL